MDNYKMITDFFVLLFLCYFLIRSFVLERRIEKLKEIYSKLLSQKKSSEVRLGQISENLAPFLKDFKYSPKKCHFLGNPIDYIVFEEDKIIFLEIKSGQSKLSETQKNIKRLIKNGMVEFDQMRIN